MYQTAKTCSSDPDQEEYSYKLVDHLLRCNGYANPREMKEQKLKPLEQSESQDGKVCLKLPYISERVSMNICSFIRKRKLPITVIFTPGKKLRELFCSSRPHDRRKCTLSNCKICPKITDDRDCSIACPIYQITCKLCDERYVGESSRTLHDRMSEHLRFATNPTCVSYKEEAMAVHYSEHHAGKDPDLCFELLETERNTILRKIKEAMYIIDRNPSINDKTECTVLQRFLIKGDVVNN